MARRTLAVLALALLAVLPPLGAQDSDQDKEKAKAEALARANAAAQNRLSFDRSIRGVLQAFCYRCHNDEKRKGDVNLTRDENPRMIAQNRKLWTTVLEVLEKGEMPPKKEKQMGDDNRKLLIEFVKATLGSLDCDRTREPGKPVTRRLNRSEYDNSIQALTGLKLQVADGFSPDATGYGFDNIGDVLSVSPVLIEQYHEGARKILSELIDKKALNKAAYDFVFFAKPEALAKERDAAKQIIERFASRAFRRPADPALIEKMLGLYDKARSKGEAHEAAVRPMLLAVLISPRFFMRIETSKTGVDGPYPVDDYDLATRLSFFLWSAPPDDLLLSLAAKGELSKVEVLEAQARRLLADPRSSELVENFFGQWLQLRGLATHKPDAKRFPQFTETLRGAMQRELDLLLGEIVMKDRPLTDVISADYAYLNEELAKHYGIDGVRGPEMRRVALKDARRGGVLTSAAVLMVQSDPERNNVPRRGNYIAASILGTPPPPPPPDVPALEDSKAAGKVMSLRELLEAHRSKPECASCHSKIDPLGFSLQNFDPIGRWRDQEDGAAIDASGTLPNGKTFSGPMELKKILMEKKDDFVHTTASNLLIYALGRGLQVEDECVLREAQKAAAAGEYKFSSLVLTIVRSFPFRNRKNPDF